ncbi:MAG: hypothetical protein IJ189_10070 [Clostridia bacterium]|nr:hypothetical protein [Clostridia bacterium]
MDALKAVIAARELLAQVTPLKQDCGRYCGGACCQSDEDGQGGMLLFPGEETLYRDLPEGFSLMRDDAVLKNAWLLQCEGFCNREDRPLSCRLFPLLPTRTGCKMDWRGWAVCPLMAHGKTGLNPAFTAAVKEAGKILYSCEEHAALLDAIHQYNEQLKQF